MEKRHLLTVDQKRNIWGEGPWVSEPEEVLFEHRSLNCRIERCFTEPLIPYCAFGGHLCGFIRLPEGYPWKDMNWKEIELDIHGGLTYWAEEKDGYWVGFNCAHTYDLMPCMENTEWRHFSSLIEYRTIDFVAAECRNLIDQILNTFEFYLNDKVSLSWQR